MEHTDKFLKFYINCILSILFIVIMIGCTQLLPHNKRQFFEKDINLSYYNKKTDEITVTMLYIISLVTSYGICIVLANFNTIEWEKSKYKYIGKLNLFVMQILALTYAILSSGLATELIKKLVSSPRPEFYYLCNYNGYTDAVESGNYTMYNLLSVEYKLGDYNNCKNNNGLIDAISSFPSGHTSTAFSSLLFSVFVIQRMLGLKNIFSLGGTMSFLPLVAGAWIAITRVQDMKHHDYDIMAGTIIGSICSIISWYTLDNCISNLIKEIKENENNQISDHKLHIRSDDGIYEL